MLAAGVLLAGCAPGEQFGFLAGGPSKQSNALNGVTMAQGAVSLTPPIGYCIDARSLRAEFALMARCDTLGARRVSKDAPLALITATLVPLEPGAAAPKSNHLAAALKSGNILQSRDKNGLALVQTRGATGLYGTDQRHWRGAFAVNGTLVGLALYAPEGGSASGKSGASILSDLAKRTSARSAAVTGNTN